MTIGRYDLFNGETWMNAEVMDSADVAAREAETGWTAVLIGEGEVTPERAIREARKTMRAYVYAFDSALRLLWAAYEVSLLSVVDAYVAANPESDVAFKRPRITIYERVHPDVSEIATLFSLTDEQVDIIFQVAMAIDVGDTTTVTALVDAWNGSFSP